MSSIALDDTEFQGRTSRPLVDSRIPTTCGRCGSQLGGRKQQTRWSRVGNTRYVVESWLCGCGSRRVQRRRLDA
jgi:hypothetical protein